MATEDPDEKLKQLKEQIRKDTRRYAGIDKDLDALDEGDGRMLIPRDDLERQRRIRELRESEDE